MAPPLREERHPGDQLVRRRRGEGTFEAAPFETTPVSPIREDFLSFFTWPTHARTRERVNWLRLPVADGQWNDERTTKGGFIQEALGWKPSPLIASVDITQLAAAAGI
ncbi:hypothetical protein [Embleya sp. NPDC059237]|uniref:hypothetical protein n=1 Tax=Embleya sp. NPDC059237 TaxID=3346784 RepID=UPI0036998625